MSTRHCVVTQIVKRSCLLSRSCGYGLRTSPAKVPSLARSTKSFPGLGFSPCSCCRRRCCRHRRRCRRHRHRFISPAGKTDRERRADNFAVSSEQELTAERLRSTQLRRSKLPKSGSRGVPRSARVYAAAERDSYRHSIDCHGPNCNIVRSRLGIRSPALKRNPISILLRETGVSAVASSIFDDTRR